METSDYASYGLGRRLNLSLELRILTRGKTEEVNADLYKIGRLEKRFQ